jgi:hypothetical protein
VTGALPPLEQGSVSAPLSLSLTVPTSVAVQDALNDLARTAGCFLKGTKAIFARGWDKMEVPVKMIILAMLPKRCFDNTQEFYAWN